MESNPAFKKGGYGQIGSHLALIGGLAAVVFLAVLPVQEIPFPYAFASTSSLFLCILLSACIVAYAYFIFPDVVANPQHLHDLKSTAVQGFIIGFVFVLSIAFAVGRVFGATAFWVHLLFRGVFHFMEFFMTALYHPETVSSESYLLNHSSAFHVASIVSLLEYWIEFSISPSFKSHGYLSIIGVLLCSVGQFIRTGAMYQAAHNFTHLVATSKQSKHKLVTSGFYSLVRHPAYFGWFWWSVGTQIILLNPICIIGYAFASWKFFADRIPFEEEHLRSFFGNEYVKYAERVPILIPFIPSKAH
jgi:protein-S-isoprenylcysteine O-methyltransferase